MVDLQLIAVIFLHLGYIVKSSDFPCTKTVSTTSIQDLIEGKTEIEGTYDLCDFVVGPNSQDGWYAAYDNRSVGNVESGGDAFNYTFYFNIASNIAKPTPDPECDNYNATFREAKHLKIGYCKDIGSPGLHNATCKEMTPITNMVAAYQAKKGSAEANEKCWRLHDGVTHPEWTFINEKDPALGIQLTYKNGDWCPYWGKNREFIMKFFCANDIKLTPDYVETVYEPIEEGCSYEFQMYTFKGCPTECVVNNDQICSGHGVCDYDFVRAAPKCFCYKGWYGEDCLETKDENEEILYQDSDNSYVGALVVVILLLLVILFILGYLFLRYTKIKNQPFDFKFLQESKVKRGKQRVASDEYEEE